MLMPVFLIPALALSEACFAEDTGKAHVKLSTKILDFGHFRADEPQDSSFTIYNDGDETLTIFALFSGCGCTRTSCTKKQIEPGDSSKVGVRFNGKGRPLGGFRKAVTIRSNASNRLVHIYVDGVIVE